MAKCKLFHKWDGIQCTKCGAFHPSRTKCDKCGKTLGAFRQEEKEFSARMKAMGAGIFFGGPGGLMRCQHCGKVVCSKCALELPGHSEKTCPFCNEDFGWGCVIS